MVAVRKKVFGNKVYYYLEHSMRRKGRVEKKEKYIGKTVPKNLESVKAEFLYEIYREKWFSTFDEIKRNFSRERRSMPRSAEERETETFSIRFTYDTQRIEGSKLTLRETADLLERGITPKGRTVHDMKEAEAHRGIFYELSDAQYPLRREEQLL